MGFNSAFEGLISAVDFDFFLFCVEKLKSNVHEYCVHLVVYLCTFVGV
jgi:hypothetical protein